MPPKRVITAPYGRMTETEADGGALGRWTARARRWPGEGL